MSNKVQWRTEAIQKLVKTRNLKGKLKSKNPIQGKLSNKNTEIIEKAKKGLPVDWAEFGIF